MDLDHSFWLLGISSLLSIVVTLVPGVQSVLGGRA